MKKNKKWRGLALALCLAAVPAMMACGSKTDTNANVGTGTETDTSAKGYEVTLPAEYEKESRNYPVVYVLPKNGYAVDDSGIAEKLSGAMEAIIVRPSFEEGADIHAVMETVVNDVDSSYRTIADKKYRAVVGTGTGGYLAYILGLTEGKDSVLTESKLFSSMVSIRGDFVSEENPWYSTYGDVLSYMNQMRGKNETVFDGFYTYMDAPVDDAWTNMKGSSNDMGALFIGFATSSAAHEFTVRAGSFTDEFLTESINRVADRLSKYMMTGFADGSVVLPKATLSEDDKTAAVNYTIYVSEGIAAIASSEVSAEVLVSVIDPVANTVLTETKEAVTINGAGEYTGEVSVDNLVNGTYSKVQLSLEIFGMKLDLGSANLGRSTGPVIDGDYQKIDLSGDWYFNYTGDKNRLDLKALKPSEYETWSVVQPGLSQWSKGYGNINDETVNNMAGEEYFNYMIVGNGYYVKNFEVPEEFNSQDLILSIGYVDDRCEVFLNGERVGATGMDESGNPTGETTWAEYSVFEIASERVVRGGMNTVVVRAWNDLPYGAGGWYGGPIGLYSRNAFENQNGGVGSSESRFIDKTFTSSYAASALGQADAIENDYLIYLPKDYEETDRYYPTVYLLHQFNSDHTSYRIDSIDKVLDAGIEAEVFDEMIVVVPNSDGNSWWTGDWEKMITEELIPLIDSEYRTIKDARYRLTAGCSMGGQGAFAVALRNPDYFTGSVSFFGAFSYGETSSPNYIAGQESAEYMDYYTLYFICGNQDSYGFGVPAIELNQLLEEKGVAHGFFIENGGHDSTFYVPYFTEAFGYVRSNMYQSNEAVEALLSGKLEVVEGNGVVVDAKFTALEGIEGYFHTIPASSYTKNAAPDLSIPLTIQVEQDGAVVYEWTDTDVIVNAEKTEHAFTCDLTEHIDTAKDYTIVYKAAIFDRVVTLDSITVTAQ